MLVGLIDFEWPLMVVLVQVAERAYEPIPVSKWVEILEVVSEPLEAWLQVAIDQQEFVLVHSNSYYAFFVSYLIVLGSSSVR